MSHKIGMLLTAGVLLLLCLGDASAIELSSSEKRQVEGALDNLRKESPELKVQKALSGLPKAIEGIKLNSASSSDDSGDRAVAIVKAFLAQNAPRLFLMPSPVQESEIIDKQKDFAIPGRWLVKVQQKVHGIPILGAQTVFTVDPARSNLRLDSTFKHIPFVQATPKISESEAAEKALAAYGAMRQKRKPLFGSRVDSSTAGKVEKEDLVIIKPNEIGGKVAELRLSWRIKVSSFQVFVDAISGDILALYRDQETIMLRRTYDLAGAASIPGALALEDPEGQVEPQVDKDATSAHQFVKLTYDFYLQNFKRDSFDGRGATLVSYVRYSDLQNAQWDRDLQAMIYGPGYASALDIVAHELSHAVTENASRLVYQGESGALNEFFSDLIGALVNGKWTIGESLPGFEPPTKPLRNMADPHNGGFDRKRVYDLDNRGQPDNMSEVVQTSDCICASTDDVDNGCVHFNSGVWNKAAWLASEGGEHKGYKIAGIGKAKVGMIFYSTFLRVHETDRFSRVAELSAAVCDDFAFAGTLSALDCVEFRKALKAVGVLSPAS